MPVKFPSVDEASPEGLLAIGGDLSPETIRMAYTQGIFPWPISKSSPLTWFSPDPRGILKLDDFHLSKSFRKFLKKQSYQIKFNEDFDQIIHHCAKVKRNHESGTWITKEILEGYHNLFLHQLAYCVAIYQEDEMVAGLYGVCINKIISGESMFHYQANTSKLALLAVMLCLKKQKIPFLDTQMVTPIIESFGGSEIPRKDFIKQIKKLGSTPLKREELFPKSFSLPDQLF
jgi:leucyl/phenylalanyl-tRNA--protein transferase